MRTKPLYFLPTSLTQKDGSGGKVDCSEYAGLFETRSPEISLTCIVTVEDASERVKVIALVDHARIRNDLIIKMGEQSKILCWVTFVPSDQGIEKCIYKMYPFLEKIMELYCRKA